MANRMYNVYIVVTHPCILSINSGPGIQSLDFEMNYILMV